LSSPQQDLSRDRALVALDQVDVARGNAKPLGDLGLRQAELLADPAKAWADKKFLSGVGRHWQPRLRWFFNQIFTKMTTLHM